MKTKILLSFFPLIMMLNASGQKLNLDLTFTAANNAAYIQPDSFRILNRTQGNETVIYWPDTTLSLEITPGDLLLYIGYTHSHPIGVNEIQTEKEQFQLFQSYPNPVKDQSVVSMYVPEKGTVTILVYDVQGHVLNSSEWQLNKGHHFFKFIPGEGNLFLVTARWNCENRSITIFSIEAGKSKECKLEYTGGNNKEASQKVSAIGPDVIILESGILDTPFTSVTYTFEFATNIPCPGTPTVTYEGKNYNTIQILSQCWLKENLDVGTMINSSQDQTNNGIMEKYCYNNEPGNCTLYGGLYQWDEMMQYTTQLGARGICPPGWHLPEDEEWKVLEGAVDIQYRIGDPIWDAGSVRGNNAGTNLKTTTGWNAAGNGADLFGFSGLPGGYRHITGNFFNLYGGGYSWTSTKDDNDIPWNRGLHSGDPMVERGNGNSKATAFSVRCLRDF